MAIRRRIAVLFSLALATTSPALAQQQQPPPPPPNMPNEGAMARMDENQQRFDRLIIERLGKNYSQNGKGLNNQELKALRDLEKAINSVNGSGGREALATASAVATTNDGKFVLGALAIELGTKLADLGIQANGTDLVIASGIAPAAMMPRLLRNQASFAMDAKDMPKAESAFEALVKLQPNDADTSVALAQIKANMGKLVQAIELFDKAIALKQAAGQPVPDAWVRVANQNRAILAAKTAR